MLIESLCETCENCFYCKVKNIPGGSGDMIKVICLVTSKAYENLVAGMYKHTKPYPAIIECSHYKKKNLNDDGLINN